MIYPERIHRNLPETEALIHFREALRGMISICPGAFGLNPY